MSTVIGQCDMAGIHGKHPRRKIDEDLLATPLCDLLDLRMANLLEAGGVMTMLDLLRCCGRTCKCKECEKQEDCDLVKLVAIRGIKEVGLQRIFDMLEAEGIISKKEDC